MLGQLPLAIQRNLHSCLLKNNIFFMEPAGFALNMPFDLTQTMGDSKMCQAHPFFPTLLFSHFTPLPLFHYSRGKKKKERGFLKNVLPGPTFSCCSECHIV